jgi:hypothetical protein
MGNFTILSWNVETFGKTKVSNSVNFIAAVIKNYDAKLVMFMETTKLDPAVVAHTIMSVFAADTWFPMASDMTGKANELPKQIKYDEFSDEVDLDDYKAILSYCYDDSPKNAVLELKDIKNQTNQLQVVEALDRAGIFRPDFETYTVLVQLDPATYSTAVEAMPYYGPPRMGEDGVIYYEETQAVQHKALIPNTYVGFFPELSGLVSTDGQGNEIGYRNSSSTFNGRQPYIIQMYRADTANFNQVSTYMPIALFHAPFGTSKVPRTAAINGLLRLNTRVKISGKTQFKDLSVSPGAIVAGDFNIDYTSTTNCATKPKANASAKTYCPFVQNGFSIKITQKSSLKTIGAADKAAAQTNWTSSANYMANAYDNIMVKGTLNSSFQQGGIIDLLQDIFNSQAGNYLTGVVPSTAQGSMYNSFVYYRTEVSDHLPAGVKFQVKDRP